MEQLVEQTRSELADLLSREYASLAKAQRCSGVGGSTSLFSSLFNYVHRSRPLQSKFSGSSGIELIAGKGITNYPVAISVYDDGEGFLAEVQTDSRLDAERMIRYVFKAVQS